MQELRLSLYEELETRISEFHKTEGHKFVSGRLWVSPHRETGISNITVMKWVRVLGDKVSELREKNKNSQKTELLDELFTYVYKKNERRFAWLAVDRNTKRILAFKVGDCSETSLSDLLEDISHCKVDMPPIYNSIISGGRLIQRKAHTFTVESKNSQLRHYLARLVRKIFKIRTHARRFA